jgi:membrane protease subunit (stomatin/prohibitin family)
MFGVFRKKIQFSMNQAYLIEKHPGKDFKKKTRLSLQKNQEVVMVYPDGLSETIKNQFDLKLKEKVKYLFYAQSNRSVQSVNWGTKSRVEIQVQSSPKTLGGYGTIEFRLMNPTRYIEKRMGNASFVTPDMLTELVLSKIPEELLQVVVELKEGDKKDINTLTLAVKKSLTIRLSDVLSEMGIELTDLVITNINLKEGDE